MLTIEQIAAIISLLIAFNVPTAQVEEIKGYLTPPPAIVAPASVSPTPTTQPAPAPAPTLGTANPVPVPPPAPTAWAQVQVYPSFTASHGGLANSRNTTVCIQYGTTKECAVGVPTFGVPVGQPYQVLVSPPAGYSYKASDTCAGTPAKEELIVCKVDYEDGAP